MQSTHAPNADLLERGLDIKSLDAATPDSSGCSGGGGCECGAFSASERRFSTSSVSPVFLIMCTDATVIDTTTSVVTIITGIAIPYSRGGKNF